MKFNLLSKLRISSFLLLLCFTISATSALTTACGSADAAKDAKAKKKKKKRVLDEESDDEAAVAEEKSPDKDPKPGISESSNSNAANEGTGTDATDKGSKEIAEKIWKDLVKGNANFAAGKHTNVNFAAVRKSLVDGQKPEVIVLGCADSRVPPEFIFDKNLGELFVIRAAGNIADSVSLGSIEYAVEHLHSKVLVILGHESCGAVTAALANEEMPTKNLTAIVNKIAPAFEGSTVCPLGGKMNNSCVVQNVDQSAKDILKNSPIVKKAVDEGHLTIIRAVYQLESGKVIRQD
jgi:carbonic anhydrase